MWEIISSQNRYLTQKTSILPGIGSVRADALSAVGFDTIADLIACPPRKYIHRKTAIPLSEIEDGDDATALVRVVEKDYIRKGKRGNLRLLVKDESEEAVVLFFNAPRWMSGKFSRGAELLIWGKAKRDGLGLRFAHPDFEFSSESEKKLIPVYPNSKLLVDVRFGQKLRSKIILGILDKMANIPDPVPEVILDDLGLPRFSKALRDLHAPADLKSLESAKRRFAFDELLLLQLVFTLRKKRACEDTQARPVKPGTLFAGLKSALPFKLTDGQNRALAGILESLNSPGRSMLLLSGDVGSGKTVVALLAACAAVDSGLQVALIVPSLLVARQHADFVADIAKPLGAEIGLLTGESGSPELIKRLLSGKIDIIIGTQALLSPKVKFKNLGLVIIDEQHRFGVKQRLTLPEREGAHTLLLSATPIPRTAALALYGDLDLQVLRGFPGIRAGVKTYLRDESSRPAVWDFIGERIKTGERVFIVHPRVEGDDFSAATFGFENLQKRFPGKTALLHGTMAETEKNRVFADFRTGKSPILATTSLIEIGVDVPEATVVIIESAEKFGLAQLHQIRGRVGRADRPGYCILLTGKEKGSRSWNRLKTFSETNDGFEIAKQDLIERREGEILSLSQVGKPDLDFADPLRMTELLENARIWAGKIVLSDPELNLKENSGILRGLYYIYSNTQIVESAI